MLVLKPNCPVRGKEIANIKRLLHQSEYFITFFKKSVKKFKIIWLYGNLCITFAKNKAMLTETNSTINRVPPPGEEQAYDPRDGFPLDMERPDDQSRIEYNAWIDSKAAELDQVVRDIDCLRRLTEEKEVIRRRLRHDLGI